MPSDPDAAGARNEGNNDRDMLFFPLDFLLSTV